MGNREWGKERKNLEGTIGKIGNREWGFVNTNRKGRVGYGKGRNSNVESKKENRE